ncbi:MAG TPA: hypothetical protein VF465_15430 [Flavobacterium sp.]
MTFLKPDNHGISILYVSLSGAISCSPLYLLWSRFFYETTKGCRFYQD